MSTSAGPALRPRRLRPGLVVVYYSNYELLQYIPISKLFAWEVGPVRNPVLEYRVCLFSLDKLSMLCEILLVEFTGAVLSINYTLNPRTKL